MIDIYEEEKVMKFEQVAKRDDSAARKNGELYFNDIFIDKVDEVFHMIKMFTNKNNKFCVNILVPQDNSYSIINFLKQSTWTLDPKHRNSVQKCKSVVSNSYYKTTRKTLRLLTELKVFGIYEGDINVVEA